MKLYRGTRRRGGTAYVSVTEAGGKPRTLALRYGTKPDQVPHSPFFSWGYKGPATAQLAFALASDALEAPSLARLLYLDFQRELIAKLDKDKSWSLTEDEISLKLDALLNAGKKARLPAEASAKAGAA